jgi:hypothetical protein
MLYAILAVVFVVLLFAYIRVRSRRLSRGGGAATTQSVH